MFSMVEQHSTDLPTYYVGSDKLMRGGASHVSNMEAHALNGMIINMLRILLFGWLCHESSVCMFGLEGNTKKSPH